MTTLATPNPNLTPGLPTVDSPADIAVDTPDSVAPEETGERATPAAKAATPMRVLGVSLTEARIRFIIALFLLWLAHALFGNREMTFLRQAFAPVLDERFHFYLSNLENSITGVILLGISAVLIWRSLPALAPLAARGEGVFAAAPTLPPLMESDGVKHPRLLPFLRRHLLSLVAGAVLFALLLIQMVADDPSHGLILVWVAAIFLFVRVAFYYDRASGVRLSPHIRPIDLLWMVGLFALALVIGSYLLDRIPNSIIGDEGNFWERAKAIANGFERSSFFSVGVYSYPLPSSFFQAGVLNVFGQSLWGWRFSSVLAAALTVFPMYLLARDLFKSRFAGVLAGVLMITLPFYIAFARLGYNNSQAIFPVALTIYLLYVGVERQSLAWVGLAGAAAGLGFYTYTAGRLGLVVGVAYFGLLFFARLWELWKTRRKADKDARAEVGRRTVRLVLVGSTFVLVAMITLLPNIVHTNATDPELLRYKTLEALFPNINYALSLYTADELYRDNPPIVIGRETLFFRADLWFDLLVRGTVRTLIGFHHLNPVGSHYIDAPLAGPVSSIFYFIGLIMSFRLLRRRNFMLLLIWFYLGVILLSIINTFPSRQTHMVPIIPVMAIFITYGVVLCAEATVTVFRPLFARANLSPASAEGEVVALLTPPAMPTPSRELAFAPVIALLITGVIGFIGVRNYFVDMPDNYTPDFEQIMSFDAVAATRPEQFVYISSDLNRAGWTPWLILQIPTNVEFVNMPLEQLQAGDVDLLPGQRYTFYFDSNAQPATEAYLERVLGEDIEPTAYLDGGDRLLGMSYRFIAPQSETAMR